MNEPKSGRNRAPTLFPPGEMVTCPHGHELSQSVILHPGSAALLQCRARDHVGKRLRGGAFCGARMWVWDQPEGGTIAVWIEEGEWETIARERMTVEQVRDFLGAVWPTKAVT